MTVAELMRRRRNAELSLFAAAIVWRNARGTPTERDAAKHLAAVTEELLRAAEELDEAIDAQLRELTGPQGRT